MYEQISKDNYNFKIFGFKLFENKYEYINIYEREFKTVDEEQTVLESMIRHTCRFAGMPIINTHRHYVLDENNSILSKTTNNVRITVAIKRGLIITGIFISILIIFICGILTANSKWFNECFYIKSRQMQNLNIRGLQPYNKNFYNAETFDMMDITSFARYDYYHKYYEKVVERIKTFNFVEGVNRLTVINYIDGYERRKAEIDYVMFSNKNEPETSDYKDEFLPNSVYFNAMLEFDRQELLAYRMILLNMEYSLSSSAVDAIFEE